MSNLKRIRVFIGYYGMDGTNSTIDANNHPEEQIELLLNVLEDSFEKNIEVLNIYTNSPYVLNKLMILQGYAYHGVDCNYFKYKLDFPVDVFEVKKDSSIIEVSKYKFITSDNNLLNNALSDSNEEFAKILELKQV